jgi:hypothetical protein
VCGTYGSTLWFADDMALRASRGFSQYNRQDLFGGEYGMTNSVSGAMALGTSEPLVLRPDYWVSWLLKRTLGGSVLAASSSDPFLRVYAYSGAPPSPFAAPACVGAPLQLLLIHLGGTQLTVSLPPVPAPGPAYGSYAAWTLAPAATGGPFTLVAALNGAALPTLVDASVVDPATFLSGITQTAMTGAVGGGISLPPISTTFLCSTP